MHLNVREIKKEDFSTCADILVAAYNGAPWNNSWTEEEALLRIEATMSGAVVCGFLRSHCPAELYACTVQESIITTEIGVNFVLMSLMFSLLYKEPVLEENCFNM